MTLVMRKGKREASAYTNLRVTQSRTPKLDIPLILDEVNPDEGVSIKATVTSITLTNLTWSCVTETGRFLDLDLDPTIAEWSSAQGFAHKLLTVSKPC